MSAPRNHPAKVTRLRLLADRERWAKRLTPAELEAIQRAWEALYRIEGEDEAATAAETENR